MFEQTQVGFIGGGNMGEALIKGFLAASLLQPEQIRVYDISSQRTAHLDATYQVASSSSPADLVAASQIVILAIKPQNMAEVLNALKTDFAHQPLVISIAAGISLTSLVEWLPEGVPVIRVMPNTPALISQGASALSRGPRVTDAQMQQALHLFQAVGTAIEVHEKWMDAVTGLSGSGPGYVLLFLESLIDAGVRVGLPRPIARELVLQTVIGTTQMVRETGKHPAELRDLITSPAGTTIAGLQVLEEKAVRGALQRAVGAATQRSQELGKG